MSNLWDALVDCICRPPRDVYSPTELLGGSAQTFMVGSMEATRLDFELVNKAGEKILCSHYLPLDARSRDGKLPVVVYCHCNSGSRRDAEEAVWHLLPCGVGVVAFDFTGSGLSDGKWVTLGAHEVDDLAAVVQHLRAQGGVSSVGLWGRSMGAVTALLYSQHDPDIAGMVLDSPFSRLTDLMLEIVVSQRLPIPKVMLRLALKLMRSSVRRKAGADINLVSPVDVVGRSLIPAMFGHGDQDTFINMQHSVKLHQAYNAQAAAEGCPVYKNLVRFKGDHNHPRPAFFYSSVCCFFHQQLRLDQLLLGGNPADAQQLLRHGSINPESEAVEQVGRANGFINTPWSLGELSPEQQAAAAAALIREQTADGSGSEATGVGTGRARSSGSGSGGTGQYNPRAVVDGNQQQRGRAAAAAAQLPAAQLGASSSSGEDHVAPPHHRHHHHHRTQQQQQHPTPAVVISSGRAAATGDSGGSSVPSSSSPRGDLFEVGSRGCLTTVPLLAADEPESDGTLGSPDAAAAAAAVTPPRAGSGSSGGGDGGGPLGPFSKLLRRQAAGSSNESSGAGAAAASRNGSDSLQAAVEAAGSLPAAVQGAAATPLAQQQQQQQQQQRMAGAPTGAGWLGAVAATADGCGVQGSAGGGATGARRRLEASDWTTTLDDADPLLAAAIAASLQDQQQQLGVPVAADSAGARQEVLQPQQQRPVRHGVPASAAEEEALVRQAIQLSLAEAAEQQQRGLQQQQQQGADAACEAVIVQLPQQQQHKPAGTPGSVAHWPVGSSEH